ncbi:MAG: DUF1499 domain-containing protein [Synergistales bacterium]|nr:DUF1499 domain-containing protein [Synergistales bacterium]
MIIRNTALAGLLLLVMVMAGGKIYSMKGPSTDSLPEGYSFGLNNGFLAPCRNSPNCVCTDYEDAHYMEPVTMDEGKWLSIKGNPHLFDECRLISSEQNYLRFECESSFFRFIDDVELFYDEAGSLLRFRSAARLGYYDLGVNRKRMERLRTFLTSPE